MLEEKQIFNNKYKIINVAGKGGMGTVYLAEDIGSGEQWAIKEAIVAEKNKKLLESEIHIMSRLNNKYLPGVREVIYKENLVYIVMDYVKGKTLDTYLKEGVRFEEKTIYRWFLQICDVLIYLHELNPPIVYRDLKPSNIMIEDDGNIKIIDFGIALEYSESGAIDQQTMALTKGYAAPEQYNSRFRYDVRTDIYALGATMHYLLTGKNPNKPPYHFDKVRKLAPKASITLEYIVGKCLQPNPDKRYLSARDLKEDLLGLERLEKSLINKKRFSNAMVIGACVIALVLAVVAYMIVSSSNKKAIEDYYASVLFAEEQIDIGEYDLALDTLEQAIEKAPAMEDAYIMVARVYMNQGDYEKQLDYIKEVLLQKFANIYENPDFLLMMGDYYIRQGDSQNAEFYYSEYDKYK